jgi:hypothetical protein
LATWLADRRGKPIVLSEYTPEIAILTATQTVAALAD